MPTQLQLDGPNLQKLLAQVRDELGPQARIVSAEKVRIGGLAGFFARERFHICVETGDNIPESPPVAPATLLELADAVSDEERRSVSTESEAFSDVLRRLTTDGGGIAGMPAAREATCAPPVPHPNWPPAPAAAVLPPRDLALPTSAPAVVNRGIHLSTGRHTRPHDRPAHALAQLGLPHHLIPQDCPHGLRAALLASLAKLPQAAEIDNGPGQVLAIVGPARLALAVAIVLIAELDLDPTETLLYAGSGPADLPSDRVLLSPTAAAQRRASWRRRPRSSLGIVAVDTPLTPAGAIHAAEYLDALRATTVWGAVEASRKPADIGNWAEFLGGIDALALQEVESTADPATTLSLGIPVSRLGHVAATPASWAALLTSRMAG
ncbi:MAG: hypothetical protein H7323_00775 [Frankiales bacterium]|nr:hypothetical protein [Frankiales bacterium]